jgi:hypothetical protein
VLFLTAFVALMILLCIPAIRGWRGGRWLEFMRSYGTRGIMRGRNADAYAAAAIPLCVSGTVLFSGFMLLLWLDRFGVDTLVASLFALPLVVAGLCGLALATSLYLFMWPAALVVMPRHVGRERATTRSDVVDG